MADGLSAEDASSELADSDTRLTRDRHKRADVSSVTIFASTGPDAAKRVREEASTMLEAPRHPRRNCHAVSHPCLLLPRRQLANDRHRRHPRFHRRREEEEDKAAATVTATADTERVPGATEGDSHWVSSTSRRDGFNREDDDGDAELEVEGDEYGDDDCDEDDEDDEEDEAEQLEAQGQRQDRDHQGYGASNTGSRHPEKYPLISSGIETPVDRDSGYLEEESSNSSSNSSNSSNCSADGEASAGSAILGSARCSVADDAEARRAPPNQANRRSGVNDRERNVQENGAEICESAVAAIAAAAASFAKTSLMTVDAPIGGGSILSNATVIEVAARDGGGGGSEERMCTLARQGDNQRNETALANNLPNSRSHDIIGATRASGAIVVVSATMSPTATTSSPSDGTNAPSLLLSVSGGLTMATKSVPGGGATGNASQQHATDGTSSAAAILSGTMPATGHVATTASIGVLSGNGPLNARHQGSPFKGQVRSAEDTLVGPCGKKRCADRYDSSESSDSGVAVSCGEYSSSGTSDITEPGSPCSTSSDEGVVAGVRGTSGSPVPCLPKLAPSSQIGTRPQWPWTPPLAATACSTYKRHKGEPEAGALPRSGAADPTTRPASGHTTKPTTKSNHHHHESQGKITEYFKTQIKPQQPKIKKSSETMSVLVAKSSSEFRRPPTVQRNKGGLAKYLGTVSANGRGTTASDWESRIRTMSPPPSKKSPGVIAPRSNGRIDKKMPKPIPGLSMLNDVLKSIPNGKITSFRFTEAGANVKSSTTASGINSGQLQSSTPPHTFDFKGCIPSKPHVNENNNLTNGCAGILGSSRSQSTQDLFSRLSMPVDTSSKGSEVDQAEDDDIEEEEEDSRSSGSKTSLSPILSAPTTIRFPAREPTKHRQQPGDSGVCRWDKCEANFECSGGLLEHLQAAHINTQTGGDNFVCQWQGCKVQGRSSCSRRWLERHVLSHGGNKPFRCIVDGCGSRFSSQTALERHVNGHFNQPESSTTNGRRSCENGGKLVRRNGKRLRYRRQPWSARLFDYFDSGVMEGLQHRLLELAKSRTQGHLAETPGTSMALTSQVLARRVELDGKTRVLLRWYPQDIEPDEWVLESEVQSTKYVAIRGVAAKNPDEVSLALFSAVSGGSPPSTRVKQRRKPVKNS